MWFVSLRMSVWSKEKQLKDIKGDAHREIWASLLLGRIRKLSMHACWEVSLKGGLNLITVGIELVGNDIFHLNLAFW